MSSAHTPKTPKICSLPFMDDTCIREKSRSGHVARLGGVRHPKHPVAGALKPQLSLLWLPDGRGGNRSNMGTLICLINSLCSGVVAVSPACSLSSSQSRAGVTQTAGHLPAQPLLGTALSPGRGAREGGFLGSRVPYITKDRSRCSLTDSVIQRMFLEHLLRAKETVRAKSLQSCPTFCDPMDWSPPGFVHGILQVRILEWVAVPSSRTSQPRD